MNYKSVLLTFSLMIFSVKSLASTVEVAQWWPWSFIESELKTSSLNFNLQARDLTLQWQDWHPLLKGATLEVKGAWTQLQVQPTGISAATEGLSALLKVPELIVNQTIVKEINGNRFEILIQATCQPFEINVPSADISLKALYVRQNAFWTPTISDLKLVVHDGWSVSSLNCHGPQGFEQVVTNLLQDSLKNPTSIASLLQNFLTQTINEKWLQIWNQMTTVGFQNLKVVSMDDPAELGFFIRGEIQSGPDSAKIALPLALQASTKSNIPQLVLTSAGFAALAKENASHFTISKYNLQTIPSFKSLMHSRFVQFFIWPDLMHFSKSAPFLLTSKPSQKFDLQSLGNGRWQLQSQTVGVIEAERQKTLQPYLQWGLGATSLLSTKVTDSLLKLSVDQSKTNMTWQYDAAYLKDFKPSRRLSKSVLQKVGDALFTGRTIEVQLPILDLKTRTLKLNNWVETQGLIWMDWK